MLFFINLKDKYLLTLVGKECTLFSKKAITKHTAKEYLAIFNKHYIISKTDKNGIVTYVNEEFLRMHGLKERQILGKTHKVVSTPMTPKSVYADLWRTITKGKVWNKTLCYKDYHRKTRFAYVSIFPVLDEFQEIVEYLALRQDVTEMVELEKEVQNSQQELIFSLGSVIESKNGELNGHVQRVSNYSYVLAKAYGLNEKKSNIIRIASPMHDAGKIGIPEGILNAPRKLSKEEFEIIKGHSTIGYDLFKNSKLDILKAAALIAYHHHEKWDGTGYPQGLKGVEISIEGRIAAVADVYDALISERPYKKGWSIEQIEDYFREESGKSFDPDIINCYFNNKQDFNRIKVREDCESC